MGVCPSAHVRKQAAVSYKISKQISQDGLMMRTTIKMLLLGTAESGKSTILKQIMLMYNQGLDEKCGNRKDLVYENTIQAMATVVKALDHLNIELENEINKINASLIVQTCEETQNFENVMSQAVHTALKMLWSDKALQTALNRSNEFQLIDSAKHFFDSLDRIVQPDYTPSEQDILRIRLPTNGVSQISFVSREMDFRVFDVRGQRSERRKWIHVFDDVSAMIYMVAVNEFDMKLIEDGETNRMEESLHLFSWVINHESFRSASAIIFMNKKDIMAEKLARGATIRTIFPDYKGPSTYAASVKFIEVKFLEKRVNARKPIYVHQTCATDANQVAIVINGVIDTLIEYNMKTTGFA